MFRLFFKKSELCLRFEMSQTVMINAAEHLKKNAISIS